jgi:hypothetical protein
MRDRVWMQWFTARRLDDGELAAALAGPAWPSTPT